MSGKVWSTRENVIIKENYGKLFCHEIAKMLSGRTATAVNRQCGSLGLTKKHPRKVMSVRGISPINHNFFSKRTLIGCYFAGLIAADGTIKNDRKFALRLADLELLEAFKHASLFEGRICGPYRRPDKEDHKDQFEIAITSPMMVNDLQSKFNITPRKSLTLRPPSIRNLDHQIAFIAGLIDGDGCIGVYKVDGHPTTKLVVIGTRWMLNWVKEVFDKLTLDKQAIKGKLATVSVIKRKPKSCQYQPAGARVEYFIDYVKQLGLPTLKRKWAR